MTTTDVTMTSRNPYSVNLLSEQGIVVSRSMISEAAREQERCDFNTHGGACCVGNLEIPSRHLR